MYGLEFKLRVQGVGPGALRGFAYNLRRHT